MCRYMYPCRYFSPIRFFVLKVIIKMASHESNEDPVKSPATDKEDTNMQSKADEKESSIVSSVNQQNEPNNTVDTEEKESLTLDTNKCADVQKKDADSIESESKHDPNLQITTKKQLDDSEADIKQEAQNMDEKQETSNADSQKMDVEKDIKLEDDKDSVTKAGSALKRKRKALRLV